MELSKIKLPPSDFQLVHRKYKVRKTIHFTEIRPGLVRVDYDFRRISIFMQLDEAHRYVESKMATGQYRLDR